MRKNFHQLSGLLTIFCMVILAEVGYSQNPEAMHWFKKGVSETDPERKIENYQKAIQESPNFVEAHYNLALAYLAKKDFIRAEAAFKSALSFGDYSTKDSFKGNILNRLASIYRKQGRFEEAEQAYQQTLNMKVDNKFKAVTLYELGQTKIFQKQYDAAINYFQQGIRISPDDRMAFETGIQLAKNQQKIDTLYQQGMASIQNQKLAEAANILNEIIALSPGHEEALKQLDRVNSLLAQNKEQRDQQIQPLYQQATTYMNSGNWTEAIKYLQRIKSIQPDYPNIDQLLARAQENQYLQLLNEQKIENLYANGIENSRVGNFTIALAHFEKVAEIDPNYKDVQSRILEARREIKRTSELAERASKSGEGTFAEFDENFQFDSNSYFSSQSGSQQIMVNKSRQLDAALDSQLVKSYYDNALDLMQKQEWQRAVILLEKIKLITPNYKSTEFLLSQAKENIQMTTMAANESSEGSQGGSSVTLIFALLAGIFALPVAALFFSPAARAKYFILVKKYDKAREIYESMLSKKPNNIKLYITLANIYINENRVDEVAIRVFERAIQYNNSLKVQLEPIVTRYYLQKAKSTDTPKSLIQGTLKEELQRMGN